MADEADVFRWCVYCEADCWADEPEHAEDCPAVTGVWPVRESDLDSCPHCGEATREMFCMDCGSPLVAGDHYALRDIETGEMAVRPEWGEVVCLGCAALTEVGSS